MRKLFLAIGIFLLLSSCNLIFFDNTVIRNNSSYHVYFEFLAGNARSYNLAPGNTETYYSHGATLRKFSSNNGRVSYKVIGEYEGEFYNTPPLPMNVRNALGISVTLSERNNLMDISSVNINPNSINDIGNIYTRRPNFISSPPSKINYVIDDNIMYIIIY